MSQTPVAIQKLPTLRPAEDFYRLRREGIGFIEQMGSRWWTDYNLHDPGITILEAFSYAITDLAYRTGWDIKDLLTTAGPAPDQAFYTARNILTVNPWTVNDFRRLMIDREGVRNAWLFCKTCACDLRYYAWCEEDQLVLSYAKPTDKDIVYKSVDPLGLYEVLLELESDPESGDLNDRKIEQHFTVFDPDKKAHTVIMELRFPNWELLDQVDYKDFLQSDEALVSVVLKKFSRSKTDNNTVTLAELRKNWRGVFYATLEVTINPGGKTIAIENAALRIFGSDTAKNIISLSDFTGRLEDATAAGFVHPYRSKLRKVEKVLEQAKIALHDHRNLDEDYCRVKRVDVEDVAVCADVEVAPDADIELVQAQIWFAVERYFNPPVPFYTLQEMADMGIPTEDIFNGPALDNGFVKSDDLEAAGLKAELRASDLINLLMDIEGVIAVNNLLLTKYDAEGNPVKGAADLHADTPNLNQISAQWTLAVTELHQPRLYFNLSRFLFYKNGLPFQARMDEALDTLIQLRGEAERPKIKNGDLDYPLPAGLFRNPEDYFPLQYSFPLTYGIGFEGLPSTASFLRRAQARQLKAYLMVYEQLLVNATAQLAHVSDLFSLDPAVDRTYFVRLIDESLIKGATDIFSGLTLPILGAMVETQAEFRERRNRFLDHLLARFGESFKEYALLLTDLDGQDVAEMELIGDKIAFLKSYPQISHDRGKAFNYHNNPTDPANVPGLKPRLSRLLGFDAGSDNERFVIVEHLLLRPKFPGDALFPACTEGGCTTCGGEDPYSFRLTYVMAGWSAPFDLNLDMRRFADRTIRSETPSHLLPKICWIGNVGFEPDLCDPIIAEIAALLEADTDTALTSIQACECADEILTKYENLFKPWFEALKSEHFLKNAWELLITEGIIKKIQKTDLPCTASISDSSWSAIQALLLANFTEIALNGWQFERFEAAWKLWLEANAIFDWTEERLQERVEAILENGLDPNPTVKKPDAGALCACATAILGNYGVQFFEWMRSKVEMGIPFKNIGPVPAPTGIAPCAGFQFVAGTVERIETLLLSRYEAYKEVSYHLWILLDLLGKLRNVYPGATLHDCDDGSDDNPVRLGSTALGNYKRKPRPSLIVVDPPAPKNKPSSRPKPPKEVKPTAAKPAKSPKSPKKPK